MYEVYDKKTTRYETIKCYTTRYDTITTSHATAQSRFAWRELRRQEAGFDDEGGGRLAVDGRGRDGLNSP